MGNFSCPVITPAVQEIYEEIQKLYPEASERRNLTATDVSGWVDIYSRDKRIPVDNITKKNASEIVNHIEKCLNTEGKSFKNIPYSIEYTYQGKKRTYNILKEEGTSNYVIFNKEGKKVFNEDSKDRRRIFANLAVQEERAVVVEYKGKKYVVNNRNQIISVITGDEMKWGEENGDRKEILRLSQIAFREKQKAETTTIDSNVATEGINILGPDTKINIYAGTGENADLSNFAERPLNFGKITAYSLPEGATFGAFESKYPIYDIGKRTYSTKQNPGSGESFVFDGLSDLFSGRRFKTVEGAFQAAKLVFTHPKGNGAKGNKYWQPKKYTQRENSIDGVYYNTADVFVLTDEGEQLLQKFQEASGTQARSLGRQIEGLDRQEWDTNSSKIMKAVIGRSFEANPQALQRLLATGNATLTHTQDKGKWGTEFPKLLMEVRVELRGNNTINQEENRLNNNKEINYGNDFRRVQETVRRSSKEVGKSVSGRNIPLDRRQDLANVLRRELGSQYSFTHGSSRTLTNQKHGTTFVLHSEVDPLLFHDFFEVVRYYVDNGELVDLHADYTGCKCFLTEDGTAGFAIEPDGNLVSVFNLGTTKGFLGAVKDVIIESGATHLDAYASSNQNLRLMYEKLLGAKAASTMDYNMEYDHDDIAKKHDEPDVVFMVLGKSAEKEVEEKHFNKDQYDEAVDWQMANVDVALPEGTAKSSIDFVNTNPVFIQFKKDIDLLSGYYEGGGRVLSDDLPSITQELDDKLNNYFMGGVELSIDDYRNLWKLIEFYADNGERRFRERKPSTSSSPSDAAQNNLAAEALTFGAEPTAEQVAAAQQRIEEQKAVQPEKPKPERPKSVAYESALNVKNSRVAQFKRVFSPQQIKDRGAMISNIFSRIIDEALWDEMDAQLDIIESDTATEEEKDQAKLRLHQIKDPITGRQMIAQEKGLPVILNEIKQEIQWDLEGASEEMKPLWQNTVDYFEELFNTQATLDIEEREGIRIIGLEEIAQTASDDDNDTQNDGDDEVGHVVSGSDGWNFQVRYTNPFDSLSRKVRGMLYEIERPNTEKDDLGQTRYYPMGRIYASLLSYLAKNMQDSDIFMQVDHSNEGQDRWGNDINEVSYPNGYPTFPVLEQMSKIYPWVRQIINRLTDDYLNPEWNTNLRYPSTGGAMASQFYTNFRKAYIPYGKVQIGNGKFGITPLNYQMEERAQLDKLEANYNNRMVLSEHSIYNSDGKINKENANWLKQHLRSAIDLMDRLDLASMPELMEYHTQHPEEETLTPEDIQEYDDFLNNVRMLLQSFGIDATQDSVAAYSIMENGKTLKDMLSDLHYIADTISKVVDDKVNSFNYMVDTRDSYNRNMWSHFFDGRGLITDASYMQSFYDSASKKTKYSYSADNYLMKTFRGACMGTLEERRDYIDEHFGKFEWFRNQKTGEWRNKWLEFWYNYDGEQKEIPYRNVDNVTEYGEDGAIIRQYSKWTPDDVWQVQSRSYDPKSEAKTAFYLAPIFSDSPMSMTVKGPRMSMEELLYGYNDDSGLHHQGALVSLVNQELWRIQYVQQRAQAIKEGRVKAIANFDGKRGMQFCFLPELNNYVFENGESFLDRMLRLKNEKATVQEIEVSQIEAIKAAIDSKMGEFIYENGTHYNPEHPLKAEQYYNMVYANAAIIQMTTVDLAFYKNDTDFQKRFKEVYAGGIQLNTNSKYGKKAENIILLSDDIITSPSYDKIATIIDNSNTLSEADKKEIKATFTDINVADAQAIRSMHSFRSVLDMMGNWTDEMEQALQHFKDGIWDRADFDIIYQTIKPFVYSVIERNDGNGGSILVPQQNKNSEICALMMYDLITNGLNDSPFYKAFSKFMEESVDAEGNPLIDMIQFESAGKVGNQGVINVSFNPSKVVDLINGDFYDTKEGNEVAEIIDNNGYEFYTDEVNNNDFLSNDIENAEANYYAVKHQMDLKLQDGSMSQEDYNKIIAYLRPTEDEIISMLEQAALVTNPDGTKSINPEVVHTIPFDNYYQQQPTPEHHIDAEATFGSQARNIAVADLPDDFEMSIKVKGGTHTFKGKDAIVDFYYELLNENLIEDFFGKGNKKGLKDIFASKEALRDAVTEIVRGNPKYGRDFAEALQLDDNGNFVLSPNSPTIFNLMQEIVTSFFKNRITKQTINGAALIQAAGIGLDKDLRMVFDKDGKLVGAECLMPLTSKRFFEPLLETKIIDGKEVKVLDPKKLKKAGLDKAIGYRIPTENKSSMMPLIIKDFTPLQNGSAIVLPAEITDIAGSDFDVDKMFIMLLSFYVQEYDMRAAREAYAKEDLTYKEVMMRFTNSQLADDLLDVEPQSFKEWFEENKEDFKLDEPIIRKIEYDFSKSPKENGRKARNNMLIQMIFGILTSKEGSEQLFNPQGFKDFKRAAKINRILTDSTLREQLVRNAGGVNPGVLPSPDTIISEFLSLLQEKYPNRYEQYKSAVLKMSAEQIQQMYVQAITAGNKGDAIEMLLNASVKDLEKFIAEYSAPESPVYPQTFAHSHARNMAGANQIGIYAIQGSMAAKYQRADVRLRPEQQFTLNGRVIANVDVSEGGKRLKNVGQMIGASADNGKDPNLSDANSTSKTAPIIGYMLRTGMSHLEAVLIMNQPHMRMSKYNSKNNKYWTGILGKAPLSTPVEVTTDMLIKSLFSPFELTAEEDKAIAGLCYRVLMQHEAQEYLTQISRADSPNGAMQNSYAKARIQRYKVDLFNAKMGQKDFPFIRIKEALNNNTIDTTASEDVVREQLKGQRMAFLHGMYSLGINSFNSLVSPYFFGAKQWFDDRIVKPILYNLNEKLSDDKKEKIVNGIYVSYITYMLSGSSLFGNEEGSTMKQKRDYYLETFPSDYQQIIQDNEDIRDLLSNVLQVKNFGSRKRVILQDVGSLSKGQKQDIQRRFDALLYSDNPVARNLAKDLLVYSYFDNGLQFTHDSFSHLFTTEFLTSFPAYTDTLNELEREITPEEEQNFIYQFLFTYPQAAYNVSNIISSDDVNYNSGTIRIDLNDRKMRKRMINEVMSPNPQLEGINVYPYIQYNGDIYVLDQNMFDQYPGTPVYHRLTPYQTYSRLPLFSIQMSVKEMANEFPVNEEQQETPDIGTVEAPIAHNEGEGDPNVGPDSMYDEFAGMDDDFDFIDPADAEQAEEASPSDAFQSEGEGELRDPFCGI